MTLLANRQRLPTPGDHPLFPVGLTFQVFKFADMVHFEFVRCTA